MIGSQGVGKTTQLEHFVSLHPHFSVVKSDRRKLVEDGVIKVNREAAPWDEIVIGGDVMKSILSASSPSIADRSWVDKCAYAQLLPYPQEILDAIHVYYSNAFPGISEDDAYIYFPPMIELVADGVRDIDKQYQKDIDTMIRFYANLLGVQLYTITQLSVQDRYLEIVNYLTARGLEF
jgi:hypothetical protein